MLAITSYENLKYGQTPLNISQISSLGNTHTKPHNYVIAHNTTVCYCSGLDTTLRLRYLSQSTITCNGGTQPTVLAQ